MIPHHVIYCDHCPDSVVEAGSNARERKPATVSHEIMKTCPISEVYTKNRSIWDTDSINMWVLACCFTNFLNITS